jgi:hypothetical protein
VIGAGADRREIVRVFGGLIEMFRDDWRFSCDERGNQVGFKHAFDNAGN